MKINLDWTPNFVKRWLTQKHIAQIAALTPQIKNNKEFRRVLLAAEPKYRKAVYEHLKPLLKFKAKPYLLLMK